MIVIVTATNTTNTEIVTVVPDSGLEDSETDAEEMNAACS